MNKKTLKRAPNCFALFFQDLMKTDPSTTFGQAKEKWADADDEEKKRYREKSSEIQKKLNAEKEAKKRKKKKEKVYLEKGIQNEIKEELKINQDDGPPSAVLKKWEQFKRNPPRQSEGLKPWYLY